MPGKPVIDKPGAVATPAEDQQWLDLAPLARVECSSEDPAFPIETAFKTHAGSNGWQAMEPGAQAVRLLFHTPVQIRLIYLVFHEIEVARIQEFVLRWRSVADPEAREIVRQRFTFSPPGTAEEQALYTVELGGLTELELSIVPEISGGPARASLAQFRLA